MPFAEIARLVSGATEDAPECRKRAIERHRHPGASSASGVSHDSGPVRITPREQSGPGRRALRRRRERVGEHDPFVCEPVHDWSVKICGSPGAERISALLIRQYDNHVGPPGAALHAEPAVRHREACLDVVRRRQRCNGERNCHDQSEPGLHECPLAAYAIGVPFALVSTPFDLPSQLRVYKSPHPPVEWRAPALGKNPQCRVKIPWYMLGWSEHWVFAALAAGTFAAVGFSTCLLPPFWSS